MHNTLRRWFEHQRWLLVACWGLLAFAPLARAQGGCDGTAVQYSVRVPVGEGDTPETLRASAIQQAQEQIVRQYCGSDVSSTTVLEDSMVASHRVLDVSRGLITSLKMADNGRFVSGEIKDQPGITANFFELKIEATPRRLPGDPDPAFYVRAAMDRESYTEGDTGRIRIELSQTAYVYVFSIGADRSISLLFPTRLEVDNRRVAGAFQFPTDDSNPLRFYSLAKQKSRHIREFVLVVATKRPLDLKYSGIAEAVGTPVSVNDTASQFALANSLLKLKRDEVAQAAVAYEIYRKSSTE